MDPRIIRVENLTKVYSLYRNRTDRVKEVLGFFRKKYHQDFYALRDVSFEVKKGESVGILGRNGAGKSTLLKLLAGVVKPTSGKVEICGKVSALLELGLGFNPELTGIENIYFGGTIMGYSRREIDARLDAILSFAEIGEFVHQPMKTYSSGMYVRLAFALQTAVDPDILIVDEALAVGDIFFVAKCMNRLRKMQDTGVALLFASHDMSAIRALCRHALLLRHDEPPLWGAAPEVADIYVRESHASNNALLASGREQQGGGFKSGISSNPLSDGTLSSERVRVSFDAPLQLSQGAVRFGRGGARIVDVKLLNEALQPIQHLEFGETYVIQAAIEFQEHFKQFVVGYSLRDTKGQALTGALTAYGEAPLPCAEPGQRFVYEMTAPNALGIPGIYTLSISVEAPVDLNRQHLTLDVLEHAVVFTVNVASDPKKRRYALVDSPAEFRYLSRSLPVDTVR